MLYTNIAYNYTHNLSWIILNYSMYISQILIYYEFKMPIKINKNGKSSLGVQIIS